MSWYNVHARIQKVLSERAQLLQRLFFMCVFVDEGDMIKIPLKEAGHHQPASKMPFKWRFAVVPMTAQH